MFACMSLWAPHTCCAHRGQKGASDPLELESWKGSGEWIRFSSSSLSLEASPVLGFFSPKVPSSGHPVGGTVSLKSGAGRPSHDGAGTAPFGGWARAAVCQQQPLRSQRQLCWPPAWVTRRQPGPFPESGPTCPTGRSIGRGRSSGALWPLVHPPATPLTLASGDHSGEL